MDPDEAVEMLRVWADSLGIDPLTPPPDVGDVTFSERHQEALVEITSKVIEASAAVGEAMSKMTPPSKMMLRSSGLTAQIVDRTA